VEDLLFGPLGAPRAWPGAIRSARRASEKRFQCRKWLEMAMEFGSLDDFMAMFMASKISKMAFD